MLPSGRRQHHILSLEKIKPLDPIKFLDPIVAKIQPQLPFYRKYRGQRNSLNYTMGMQSAKSILWEMLQDKRPSFFLFLNIFFIYLRERSEGRCLTD